MDKMNLRDLRISHLPPYQLGSIAHSVVQARVEGRDVIDLSQINPDLGPPPIAVDKLVQKSLQPHNHRYTASQGINGLRKACADWYERRHGVMLDSDREVVATMGTKEGISHLLLSICFPGDSILVPTPAYPIHRAAAFIAGASFLGVSLCQPDFYEDGDRTLTADNEDFFVRLEKNIKRAWPRPKAMLVSFPHNPTTLVADESFFERLLEVARKHQMYIIHDFAYADISFDGYKPTSILSIDGAKDLAVEFYSFSKSLNIGGWRVGFCAGNEQLIAALRKIKSYLDCGTFQPLQIATIAAIENAEDTIAETNALYKTRRDVFVSALNEIGWEVQAPKASMFVWARLPENCRKEGSEVFAQELLQKCNIAVCPGAGFDSSVDEFVRFALVEPEQRLRAAAKEIKSFLDSK